MQNPNALISMAQVSQNSNNPFLVFTQYIKYCLSANGNDSVSILEIKEAISNEFGIYMPYNIIYKCIMDLEKEGFVLIDNHKIKITGTFDVEAFDNQREKYRKIENEIIDQLILFGKKYKLNWDKKYAREQIIKVLDRKGMAFDIFVNKKLTEQDENNKLNDIEEIFSEDEGCNDSINTPLYSDDFFTARFIDEIISTDNSYKDYLYRICEGLMLCVGTYQLPDVNSKKSKLNIKGTIFYFDTRLLLRFLGCGSQAAVTAVKELVDLIQKSGGMICYYKQTLEEMNKAFDKAIRESENRRIPSDIDMSLYALSNGNNATIMKAKKASLKAELEKAGITIKPSMFYSEKDRMRYGFDVNDFEQYMLSELKWDAKTIENDAMAIWETHMQRRGNYDNYCGTNDKLCVFVTTNPILIAMSLNYKSQRPNVNEIKGWKHNRLPIITDIRLTCRLWNPSEQSERMSILYLTSNIVAAQRPSKKYLEKIRNLTLELKNNVPEYSEISLPEFFNDDVTDAVLESTNGQEENLNIGTFTSTITELVQLKAKEQEEKTYTAEKQRDDAYFEIQEQKELIISSAVKANSEKLGWLGILITVMVYQSYIISLIIAGLSAYITIITSNCNIIISIIVSMFFASLSGIGSSIWLRKRVLKCFYSKIELMIDKRIKNHLRDSEMQYSNEILLKTKNKIKLWKLYKDGLKNEKSE